METESQTLTPLPGYEHVREIAQGGYGFVHLFKRSDATATEGRFVAGKFVYRHQFLQPNGGESAGYRRAHKGLENFRSLTMDSPHLLRIHDVHQRHDEGYFCYLMELADDLVNGTDIDPASYRPRTLKNELNRAGRRRRLPARECIEITIQLAQGLKLLHEAGFAHRDVRPSNIIYVGGVPKLADIDLLTEDSPESASYIPPDYAAPEGNHSRQADLYSLGLTLYEMSTGKSVRQFPCLPSDLRTWNDHDEFLRLNRILGQLCAREPVERLQTVDELLGELNTSNQVINR